MDGFTRKREMIQTVAGFFVLKFSAFNLICRLRCFKIKVIKRCGTGSTDRQRGKSRNESVENSPVSEEELGETMASIRDVAIKAGVGIGTVSRALNGSGYISHREHVHRQERHAVAAGDAFRQFFGMERRRQTVRRLAAGDCSARSQQCNAHSSSPRDRIHPEL